MIDLVCTSNMFKPAATLSWRINDIPAPTRFVVNRRTVEHSKSGLETSVLGLRFPASRDYFHMGVARIKCEADIAGGVWATSQSQVLTAGKIPGKEASDWVNSSSEDVSSRRKLYALLIIFTLTLN